MLFDKKIKIMKLVEPEPYVFEWQESKGIWANTEQCDKSSSYKLNLFSRVGIGVKSMVFTLRKTSGIDLHCAIQHKGRQYFITDINTDSPLYMTITTADIQPIMFSAYQIDEREGEYKSAVYNQREIHFPAVLTEKYITFNQENPMAKSEAVFVLVSPKSILLEVHDVVKKGTPPVDGETDERLAFSVKKCHVLDENKNEYEITREEDV